MPESLHLKVKFKFSYVRHLAFVSFFCNRLTFLSDELLFNEYYELMLDRGYFINFYNVEGL
jgi:hypothetical protein